MYDTLLETIAQRMQSSGEVLQPACSPECLKTLQGRVKQELGCEVPEQYLRFLTKANGLDWNGIVVYASERTPIVNYPDRFIDGIVEANLDFRDHDPMSNYLVFGDDGVALFTYHHSESKYKIITRVGLSSLEAFDSFDDLLASALSGHV